MSYCRFIEGDVYAYPCTGGVQFWVTKKGFDRLCNTYNDAYQYAKELRDKHGLDVPDHAIRALREDAVDETNRFNGRNGIAADLLAENKKLRDLVAEMFKCVKDGADCKKCREKNDGYACAYVMRELGIEVDA